MAGDNNHKPRLHFWGVSMAKLLDFLLFLYVWLLACFIIYAMVMAGLNGLTELQKMLGNDSFFKALSDFIDLLRAILSIP